MFANGLISDRGNGEKWDEAVISHGMPKRQCPPKAVVAGSVTDQRGMSNADGNGKAAAIGAVYDT